MGIIKIPPLNEKFVDKDGRLTPAWYQYFRDAEFLTNRLNNEVIPGAWTMPRKPSLVFTANTSITRNMFGKSILFETGGDDLICTLPSVSADDVHSWITIIKTGSGSILIRAADQDRIESSRPGGYIISNYERTVDNLTLYLAAETQWGIMGTGAWGVY